MRLLFTKLFTTAVVLFAGTSAMAVPVTLDFMRATVFSLNTVTVDQNTGKYYERRGFQGEQGYNVYADRAAFEAGTVEQTITLNTPGYYGFYHTVRDGKIFGRTTAQTGHYGRWDLASGNLDATTFYNQYNPLNGHGTFDLAGFTSMNTISNTNTTYVMGRENGGNDWRVERIDANLNSTFVGSVTGPFGAGGNPGFGFIIGDNLFLGDTSLGNQISTRYNLVTGVQSVVDFTFQGAFGSSPFWLSMVYDHLSDTLVAWDNDSRSYYQLRGAAGIFGVTAMVSEPRVLTLALLGVCALVLVGRRRAV